MNTYARKYLLDLEKNLSCTRKTKKQMLRRFASILQHFISDNPSPTEKDLYLAFGTPNEMAQALMEEMTQEQHSHWRNNLLFKRVVATIVIVFFVIFTAYVYFYKEKPLNVTTEYFPEATHLEESMP